MAAASVSDTTNMLESAGAAIDSNAYYVGEISAGLHTINRHLVSYPD
jgi:hypothetical protein